MTGGKTVVSGNKSTPHRLKKRYPTRITATPRVANLPSRTVSRAGSIASDEEIETDRDYWWARSLPSSPAPSPPPPKDLCQSRECSPIVPMSPNETQVFVYRNIPGEKSQWHRDALGRHVAGRHSFPARGVTFDRCYFTPSPSVQKAHGIKSWPAPPMESIDYSGLGVRRRDFNDRDRGENITAFPTPSTRESMGIVHTKGRNGVPRRPRRLFFDESKGGMEEEYHEEENGNTLEGEGEDMTAVNTALRSRDKCETSSSRKRHASKSIGVRARRRIFSGVSASGISDGVRLLSSSEEEMEENEEAEESPDVQSFSGDVVIVDEENSVIEDPNSTLEFEEQENGGELEAFGAEMIEEDNELRMDESDKEEEEKEEEMEDDSGQMEESAQVGKESSASEKTLHEERSESPEDEDVSDGLDGEMQMDYSIGDASLIDNTLPLDTVVGSIVDVDLRRLLAVCKQKNVMDMEEFMAGVEWGVKVGEGGYAEVFLVKRQWEEERKVFKLLPLAEDEDAGKFFGEVIISKELTRLRSGRNSTSAFAKLYRASVIQGLFPRLLSDAWEVFREKDDDAINEDNPETNGDSQLYLCLECEYGGLNLKKFPFSSILEVISVFCQTALALAVAESEFKFEHRDLHEENVLVKRTEEQSIEFTYDLPEKGDGPLHQWKSVPTHGVKTTIIDFTLSRMTRKPESRRIIPDVDINHEIGDDICNQDESAEQYQVYKKMKKLTKGNWALYTPKSNVLWLRMQMNWIIQENLNATSELNKARVKASKAIKEINKKSNNSNKRQTRRSTKKSSEPRTEGEEERVEMSGEQWKRKLKEGVDLIKQLKKFSKSIDRFESADDLVRSKDFAAILNLL